MLRDLSEYDVSDPLDRIAEQVDVAASDLLATIPNFQQLTALSRAIILSKAVRDSENPVWALRDACRAEDSFGSLRNGWIQTASSGHAIQDHMLPILLVRKALEGENARGLLAECRTFATRGTSSAAFYAAIAGISVCEATALVPGVELIPWSQVPACHQKTAFEETGYPVEQEFHQIRAKPGAAVRILLPQRQVLFPSYPNLSDEEHKKRGDDLTARYESVLDVVRCIVVQVAAIVGQTGSWLYVEDKIAREIAATGYSYGADLFDRTVFGASLTPQDVDGTRIRSLMQNLAYFPQKDLRALRIGVDRLRSSFREIFTVDKAIDLGIALEALLLHDTGSDRGELKFRTAVRGAAFLGGSKTKRLRTLALLKSAYDHRSVAVHTGDLTKKPEIALKEIQEAQSAAAEIARRIIAMARFPKWDEDFVVGGDPHAPTESNRWRPFTPSTSYKPRHSKP